MQLADASNLLSTLRRSRETGSGFALVTSMQGLRPPKGWDNPESDSDNLSARAELARFLDQEGNGEPIVDLLIVDEAHHMRNPSTMVNRLGTLISEISSYRLFLSATPIHLRNQDLHSILKMVDPDTFEYANTLDELIDANAPLVAARDCLLNMGAKSEIEELLNKARRHELLGESIALEQITERLTTQRLDPTTRSELAYRLEHVNQLANYVNRTRRRDIQLNRVVRDAKTPEFTMNKHEKLFYKEISHVVNCYAEQKNSNELFLLAMPQRLLTSSLAAASSYWSSLKPSEAANEVEESDIELDEYVEDIGPLVSNITKRVNELCMTAVLRQHDTKFDNLLTKLNELWVEEPRRKIIVFSSFIPTLKYLRSRLREEGIRTELLHGSVRESRSKILQRFECDPETLVLLSSEVGGEGVDLQFCSIIVNYDIPWNPMRLEQRIGRIDRLGQQSEKIVILNLIFDDTIDSRIYHRLYKRLTIGERALGEMEAILGQKIREMTIKLLQPNRSEQQKQKVVEQTAIALELERKLTDQLESEAASLVHHGDYILDRIYDSRNNGRWLDRNDIHVYVRDRLEKSFPGTTIETSPPGSDHYKIALSNDGYSDLSYFLSRKKLSGSTRILSDDARQRFTFTESVVQRSGRVETISQLHPLVRFCVDIDNRDLSNREAQAVATVIRCNETIAPGVFVLVINRWSSSNYVADTSANSRIGYVGANVETREILSPDRAEYITNRVKESITPMVNPLGHRSFGNAISVLQEVVIPKSVQQFEEFINQTNADINDRLNIRLRAINSHLNRKFNNFQQLEIELNRKAEVAENSREFQKARNLRNLVLAQSAQFTKLERRLNAKRSEIERQRSPEPEATDVCVLFVEVCKELTG